MNTTTFEKLLKHMELNANNFLSDMESEFYLLKEKAVDYIRLYAILSFIILIPMLAKVEIYLYSIEYFLITYVLLIVFLVLIMCFLVNILSYLNYNTALSVLHVYKKQLAVDKVRTYINLIHYNAYKKAAHSVNVYQSMALLVSVIIIVTFVYFLGVIPTLLKMIKFMALLFLGSIFIWVLKKYKIQKALQRHIKIIDELEDRPRDEIERLYPQDRFEFVKIYGAHLKGYRDLDYNSLTVRD